MASPWSELTKASEAAKQINSLQNALELHLENFADTPLPHSITRWLNPKQVVQYWAANVNGHLNDAPFGVSLADLLFVATCYGYTLQRKLIDKTRTLSTKVQMRDAVCKLQQLSMGLPDKHDIKLQETFEECVALVIWKLNPSEGQQLEVKKPRGFGMDYGDPQDEYKGDDMQQMEDLELAKKQEAVRIEQRMAASFLAWCSRTFFHLWHADLLYMEFKEVKREEEEEELPYKKFDAWMAKQCAIPDLPADFYKKLQSWTFRQLAGVGAELNMRRVPHMRDRRVGDDWARVFLDNNMQTQQPHETWLRKQKPHEIHEDLKHPLRDTLHLAMFATIFDCSYPGMLNFADAHVLFRDELLTEQQMVREGEEELLPRCPLIIQTGSNRWQIHHDGAWLPPAPMRDNLVRWCLLMRRDRESCLLSGTSITDWLGLFL